MNLYKMKILLGILSCAFFVINGCGLMTHDDRGKCTPPPYGFDDDALIGTWDAGSPSYRVDKLIFREDGLYKQIVSVPAHEIDYESDWNEWWIDYEPNGIPYLHLKGMSLCGWAPDVYTCDTSGSGARWWYDGCRDESIQIPEGEVVLFVLGVPEKFNQPPRGIKLAILGGHDRSWSYNLIEP